VDEETTTFLSATFDGTNEYSVRVVTDATATRYDPWRYKLSSIWNDWGTASTDAIEVYFTSNDTLDDADVCIILECPGDSSDWAGFESFDNCLAPLASTTGYTGNQAAWTVEKTNDYKAVVESVGCEEGVGHIWIQQGYAGTVYYDPIPIIVSND
jgi:hypothetical protein